MALQDHFMAEERHLPSGDTKRTKATTLVEHRAFEEILPVDNGMKNNTPHFQFTSF